MCTGKSPDIERALGFYRDVLGFDLQQRFGTQAAFIAAGDYRPPYRPQHLGERRRLLAAAWHHGALSPRDSLSRRVRRLPMRSAVCVAAGIKLDGASDHGCQRGALSARSGWQRRRASVRTSREAQWPTTADGELAMVTKRLDLNSLLAEKEFFLHLSLLGERSARTGASRVKALPAHLLQNPARSSVTWST